MYLSLSLYKHRTGKTRWRKTSRWTSLSGWSVCIFMCLVSCLVCVWYVYVLCSQAQNGARAHTQCTIRNSLMHRQTHINYTRSLLKQYIIKLNYQECLAKPSESSEAEHSATANARARALCAECAHSMDDGWSWSKKFFFCVVVDCARFTLILGYSHICTWRLQWYTSPTKKTYWDVL